MIAPVISRFARSESMISRSGGGRRAAGARWRVK
jgi:hypothetical protein